MYINEEMFNSWKYDSFCVRITRKILHLEMGNVESVSYTHLDVYKRQVPQSVH